MFENTSQIAIGKFYRLNSVGEKFDRGSAQVVEIVDNYRVVVRWADGVERKINVCSLDSETETATNSPEPVTRAPSRHREVFRRLAALKDARHNRQTL